MLNVAGNKRNVKLKQQLTNILKTKHKTHEPIVKWAFSFLITEYQLIPLGNFYHIELRALKSFTSLDRVILFLGNLF